MLTHTGNGIGKPSSTHFAMMIKPQIGKDTLKGYIAWLGTRVECWVTRGRVCIMETQLFRTTALCISICITIPSLLACCSPYTGAGKIVGHRFGEFCPCWRFPPLPQLAWKILATLRLLLCPALYLPLALTSSTFAPLDAICQSLPRFCTYPTSMAQQSVTLSFWREQVALDPRLRAF